MTNLTKRLVFASALALTPAVTAHAAALHGACLAGDATCGADNGAITPITVPAGATGLSGFGWQSSPAQSGDLEIVILVPQTQNAAFGDGAVTGTGITDSITPVQHAGIFSSGDLGSFLGIPGTPNNPIGGFEVNQDASVTGFDVYTVNVGDATEALAGPSSPLSDVYALSGGLPAGTDLVAFLLSSGGNTATALSGQLQLQNAVPAPTTTPLPSAVYLFGSVLAGGVWLSRKRRIRGPGTTRDVFRLA